MAFVDSMGRFITIGLKTLPVELSTFAEAAGDEVAVLHLSDLPDGVA